MALVRWLFGHDPYKVMLARDAALPRDRDEAGAHGGPHARAWGTLQAAKAIWRAGVGRYREEIENMSGPYSGPGNTLISTEEIQNMANEKDDDSASARKTLWHSGIGPMTNEKYASMSAQEATPVRETPNIRELLSERRLAIMREDMRRNRFSFDAAELQELVDNYAPQHNNTLREMDRTITKQRRDIKELQQAQSSRDRDYQRLREAYEEARNIINGVHSALRLGTYRPWVPPAEEPGAMREGGERG